MTTITINERTIKGKSLLDFLQKFEGENFINFGHEPNATTAKAIQNVISGKHLSKSFSNTDELFKDLKI